MKAHLHKSASSALVKTAFRPYIESVKKLIGIVLVAVFCTGFGLPDRERPVMTSEPARLHLKVDAFCGVGDISIPAWGNPDYPLFDAVPRVKVGMVSLVPGTNMYGSGFQKLVRHDDFINFIRYYSSNLHLITVAEEYGFFGSGQERTAGFTYNALANAGITPDQAKSAIEHNLMSSRTDWTIPGSIRNFDSVKVATFENQLDLKRMMYDLQKCASGEVLGRLSQTTVPLDGWAESPINIEMTQPYTTIPVVLAQNQYLDFLMRPVGTQFDGDGKPSTTSDAVTYARSQAKFTDVENISVFTGKDGVKDISVNAKVVYQNEFRFQCEVDPPNLSGAAMIPVSPTELGITTLYAKDGSVHKVQSTKVIDNLYRWLPESETAYKQELFMAPAVRERVLDDRTYWEVSKFRLVYPEARFENGARIVEEKSVDIDPCKVEELNGEIYAYVNVTNLPGFEEAKNTAFIEKVDRPFRLIAVYEPAELAPRGNGTVSGSTTMKLTWNVTSHMKELARRKSQEDGENWWKGSFPTYYTINIKGDVQKKYEKINPLTESLFVDGLKPGGKYYWEIETWVSDDWGSSGLKNTWKSDVVTTLPMPALVGKCVQTSAIKMGSEIDSDGFENWVITVPTVYELGNVKLKPLKFQAVDRTKGKFVLLEGTKGAKISEELENNKKIIRCRIRISEFPDVFEKNSFGQNVIHVEFVPLQVKVVGDCVDQSGKVIGQVQGTAGTWWPAADGEDIVSPLRSVEAPLLIKGAKLWRFSKWNWVGAIVATRMPYVDGDRGVSILVCKANGCQPDPDKPLEPKFYAQYEEVPVDCFTLGLGFAANWKQVANKGTIPASPEPDCPGNPKAYMAGTKVTVGPAPEIITINGDNYTFVGWIVGDQAIPGRKTVTITMERSYTVYANYQISSSKFQLSWYVDVDGRRVRMDIKVNPPPDADGFYAAGTMLSIGPVPQVLENGKYKFTGWAVDGKVYTTDKLTFTIDLAMDDNHRVALLYELAK